MAHVGHRMDLADTEDLMKRMAQAVDGSEVSAVAQAALDLALGLWAISGDVTREMALQVVTSQIENLFRERSN